MTFSGLREWNKIQISQSPGKRVALAGVVLALVGLLMSLFLRPRRIFVRAREDGATTGSATGAGTLVEVAALDRSGGGDMTALVGDLTTTLQAELEREST